MPLPETIKKLKRFFFSKLSKQTVILLFVFGLLFSLVPLKTAQAGIAEWIAEKLYQYAVTIAGTFTFIIPLLVLADFLSGGITAFVSLLLWVMMKISFAIPLVPKAGGTDAVSVGFAFTRDLANIGFVLVLAWVAFATILRIRTYQLKSILPKLLIIAVLVNFIPVITGFIVDVANVVTVIFQDEALGAVDQWLARFGATSWISNPGGALEGFKDLLSNPTVYLIVKPIGNIVVNFFSNFIFLFYALIFIIRVVAIWVLIILAPLCWLGYIIPGGKKWWSFWWNQFILWTIIGIPIFFFLYLAGYLLQYPMPCTAAELPGFWNSLFVQVPADLLCDFLPYLVSIIILWIGMGLSLSLAPRGSKGIIGGIKKAAKWGAVTAGTVAGVAAAKHGGALTQQLGQRLSEKAAQNVIAAQTAGKRGWGWKMAGAVGTGLGWGGGEAMTWATKAAQKQKIPLSLSKLIDPETVKEMARKRTAEAEASVKPEHTVAQTVGKINKSPDWAARVGYINKLIKEGDIDDAIKAGLDPNLIDKARKEAKKWDGHKEIESALPHLAEDDMRALAGLPSIAALPKVGMNLIDLNKLAAAYIDPTKGIINKIKPHRAGQVSAEIFASDPTNPTGFKNPEAVIAMLKGWDGRHFGKFLDVHGVEASKAIESMVTILGGTTTAGRRTWLQNNNPRLLNWITNNPLAQGSFSPGFV